jgi:hypothetical protein
VGSGELKMSGGVKELRGNGVELQRRTRFQRRVKLKSQSAIS